MAPKFKTTQTKPREKQQLPEKPLNLKPSILWQFMAQAYQKVFCLCDSKFGFQLLRSSWTQSIKHMVIPLSFTLFADPRLLQKVVGNKPTNNCHLLIKKNHLATFSFNPDFESKTDFHLIIDKLKNIHFSKKKEQWHE